MRNCIVTTLISFLICQLTLPVALRADSATARSDLPPNVILIVIDTLGARHLGVYTDGNEHSPNIDALAAQGATFIRAHSVSSWTKPAIASILTSKMPSYHGVTELGIKLSDAQVTLAERLRDAGYATAGIVSHTIMKRKSGYAQGFDHYLQLNRKGNPHKVVSSELVSNAAVEWLDLLKKNNPEKPFFLFLHYFDPHFRYMDHEQFSLARGYSGTLKPGMSFERLMAQRTVMKKRDLEYLRNLFREEVAFTDQQIGRVIEHVKKLGHAGSTLTLLTSDHGEEFMEHSSLGHTMTLFEEITHIPFIVVYPGGVKPGAYPAPVSQLDVMPTILDICGLKTGENSQGVSLRQYMGAAQLPLPERAMLAEVSYRQAGSGALLPRLDAVWHKRQKLIIDKGKGRRYFFHLESDPGEKSNLIESRPESVARLQALLENYRQQVRQESQKGSEHQKEDLSDQEIENLKSLGYL